MREAIAGKPARIVFFGNERLSSGYTTAAPTLSGLISAGYEVAAVITNQNTNRSRKPRPLEVQAIADAHGIPVLTPHKPIEIAETLRAMQPQIGILVAYGRIVPQAILDIFPHGILNIHPSLLPKHRGSIPIESVILNGETETGVSIMRLVKAMDAGPVYRRVPLRLRGDETKQELTTRLLTTGKDALLACLPDILNDRLQPIAQDDSQATYDELLRAEDGVIDAGKPAIRLEREIRAFAIWPKSRLTIAGKACIVTRATALHAEDGYQIGTRQPGDLFVTPDKRIGLQTYDGVLLIETLIPAGRSEMDAAAFLAGNQLQ